ncbi:MAG: hypothetical protein LBL52_02975 [Rickettsiales bacterium]|jgi:hypothetical protein|nr:hypothetical protein [Rickettsiales bacterium]
MTFLPAGLVPHCIVVATFALVFWTSTIILRREYEWLVPQTWLRGVLALLLALAPAGKDAYMGLLDWHYILWIWLLFLGLRPIGRKLSRFEIVLLPLAMLTSGECVSLLPVYAARAMYDSGARKQDISIVLGMLALSVLLFCTRSAEWNMWYKRFFGLPLDIEFNFHKSGSIGLSQVSFKGVLNALNKVFFDSVVMFAWFGRLSRYIAPYGWLFVSFFMCLLLVAGVRRDSISRPVFALPVAAVASCMVFVALMAAVKGEGEVVANYLSLNDVNVRHFLAPQIASAILWVFVASRLKPHVAMAMSAIFVCVFSLNTQKIAWMGPNVWLMNLHGIEKARNNPELFSITLPYNPLNLDDNVRVISIGRGLPIEPVLP